MAGLKILFICEKWAECDPTHGLSNAHHNFIGSFRATGIGAASTFFFDEYVWANGIPCDAALIEYARKVRPDLIFVTPVRGTDLNPKPETLARLRADSGAAMIVLNGDSYDDAAIAWMECFLPGADLIVVQDCYSYFPGRVSMPEKYLIAWTPQDPNLYFTNGEPRSIDLSFVGSVARYPDRKRALGMLADAGIAVVQGGGQAEGALSVEDYSRILRRSKIVLNFARPAFVHSAFQCKGRVIEATLSGALLFEQSNPETAHWLKPDVHYVAFMDERDLCDKVRHYLAHEDERAILAEAGRVHADQHLSAAAYWDYVIASVRQAKATV